MNREKKREVSEKDNTNCDESLVKHQSISIQQWYEYAKAGIDIPVKIPLYGSSMEPLIRCKKDIVTVVPLKRELFPGDIVLFERPDGAFVVHRLYQCSLDGCMIQTWGDNCIQPDQEIYKEKVLGIVVCVEKNGRQIKLDTEKQRKRGVRWMHNSIKRKIWFLYRDLLTYLSKGKKFISDCLY